MSTLRAAAAGLLELIPDDIADTAVDLWEMFRDTFRGDRARNLACTMIAGFEDYREFAYPDPASPLAKATRSKPWGRRPAQEIFDELPANVAMLSGAPWTVGFGSTGKYIDPETRYSRAVAEANLEARVETHMTCIRRIVTVPLASYELAALVSFRDNIGPGRVAKGGDKGRSGFDTLANGDPSTLLRLINENKKRDAAEQFGRWVKTPGVESGLKIRRAREREMWLGIHPLLRVN